VKAIAKEGGLGLKTIKREVRMTKASARRYLFAVAVTGLALLCFSPTIVRAQSGMSAQVPFDFYVGTQKLPAGSYKISHPATDLVQFNDSNKHSSIVLTNGINNKVAPSVGKLVFNKYGDNYFLTEVLWTGSTLGRQLVRSKLELQMARNNALEKIVAATK
jgi:hypothetical protein